MSAKYGKGWNAAKCAAARKQGTADPANCPPAPPKS
jgi:hypothetical protein